jgi:uncharacterized membrane protein
LTDATLRACGSGTCRGADPHLAGACACRTKVVVVFVAAVSHDTSFWCPMGLLVLVVVLSVFWRCRPTRWERAGDGELADWFAPPRRRLRVALAMAGVALTPALVLGFARLS